MENNTLGTKIGTLRKQRGMTQMELAQQMGVTDKAVSKWERDLACPDIHSLPRLAQVLQVGVEELLPDQKLPPAERKQDNTRLKLLVLRSVAMAMGIAMVVLSLLGQLDAASGLGMAGVGLTAVSLHLFFDKKEPNKG